MYDKNYVEFSFSRPHKKEGNIYLWLPKRLSHLDGLENDRYQLQMVPLIIDFKSKFRLGMQ